MTIRPTPLGFTILLVLATLTCTSSVGFANDDLSGRDLIDQVHDRHSRPFEASEALMTLIDRDGSTTERTLARYKRDDEEGGRFLLVFKSPSKYRGVASLTWEKENELDDQWTFLPSIDQLTRVVGRSKRSYFMGTDLTNEDLVEESRDEYRYERQPDEVVGDIDHHVVDAYPATEALQEETGYDRRRIYIRKDVMLDTITEFFERRSGRHIKTLEVREFAEFDGVLRPVDVLVNNLKENHQTVMNYESWVFDEGEVGAEMFTHRHLTRKRHMR